MQINPTSPFQQVELLPIEQAYSYEATVFGLRLPDGQVVINFNQSTKYSLLKDIARLLKAEVVQVKGTWVFSPAVETNNDNE